MLPKLLGLLLQYAEEEEVKEDNLSVQYWVLIDKRFRKYRILPPPTLSFIDDAVGWWW